MSDYISRKDVLAALSGLLKDIKEHPIGNGEDAYKDGFWEGEKACTIEAILRIKDLPAVEIPPHGRLIDADALISQYKGNIWTAKTDYAEGLRDMLADIKTAPTIIPAEEEEE